MAVHDRNALLALAVCSALALSPTVAKAEETFKCVGGERIEKKNSTWGYARAAGSDIRIETTSESVGFAKKANDD